MCSLYAWQIAETISKMTLYAVDLRSAHGFVRGHVIRRTQGQLKPLRVH